MKHLTVGQWALFAITGVLLISFMPERYRYLIIGTVLLGGSAYIYAHGSLNDLGNQLRGE